mgnify:CR=1 FL=1
MYELNQADIYNFAASVGAEAKKKGDELFFKYCPYCKGAGHDRETFSINLDTGTFKCFRASCGKQGHFVELARDFGFKLDNGEIPKYRELPQKQIEVKPKAVEYLESRGISAKICEKYKITTQTKNDNILVFPFYDEQNRLQFVKYRNTKYNGHGNKEWCEKDTKPILFGMAQCEDFERLIITEGQIDSLSVAESGFKNAVSVPTGAQGFTWLANVWDWISKFNEIVVFGDCEKGKITLIDTLEKRLKGVVKCVRKDDYLCEKDANDILRKYGKEAIKTAINNAELREIKYVKRLADVKSVNLKDLPKIETGIKTLDRVCGGVLYGHVVLLSGKRGEGKSTFMSQIIAEALEQEQNVFAYSGELPNYHFKNWLDLQIAGSEHIETAMNKYGDEEYFLTDETVKIINRWYYDRMFIFDNDEIPDDDFTGLLDLVTDSICRYNIKLVCIDNLMTAMDCDVNSDLYRQQSNFVKSLEKIAHRYNVAIILVAHPKKSNYDFDNDSVSGSSDITNAVSFVWNYERAKDGEECNGKLMVTKNRMTGALVTKDNAIKLYYSSKSKRITENCQMQKDYSCFRDIKTKEYEKQFLDLPF